MMSGILWVSVATALLLVGVPGIAQDDGAEKHLGPLQGKAIWEQVTEEAAFSPRDCARPVVHDGAMWLGNGYYHGGILSPDLWRSTDGVEWTLKCDQTPYDGYSPLVSHDGKLWAISGTYWNSEDGESWTQVEPADEEACGHGWPVMFRDEIWTLGNEVWRTTDAVTWTQVCDSTPWRGRSNFGCAVYDDKLWVLAGAKSGENDPPEKGYPQTTTLNDVWCSEDGVTWVQTSAAAPWAPRMWVPAITYAGYLWIVGGYDNVNSQNLGDIWYTRDGSTWYQYVSEPSPEARHASSLFVYDDSLWVVAGNTWPVVNDVWRLTIPQEQ